MLPNRFLAVYTVDISGHSWAVISVSTIDYWYYQLLSHQNKCPADISATEVTKMQ